MLKFTRNESLANGVGLNLEVDTNIFNFCQVLIDLHIGLEIKLDRDFELHISDRSASILSKEDFRTTKAYFKADVSNTDVMEYLVVEGSTSFTNMEDEFVLLQEYIKNNVPELYRGLFDCILENANMAHLFSRKSMLMFCFKNGILQLVTTMSDELGLEPYLKEVVVRPELLTPEELLGLSGLLDPRGTIRVAHIIAHRYSAQQYPLSLFIKSGYFRLNSIELAGSETSLLFDKTYIQGTYKTNASYVSLITTLLDLGDSYIQMNPYYRAALGKQFLLGYDSYLNHGSLRYVGKRDLYPTILLNTSTTHQKLVIGLSNDDKEFLDEIRTLEPDSIYNKHKTFLYESTDKVTRGCKVLENSSKTIRVTVREDRKRLSDEEAYKNRIFRDYMSHAVSLLAIPLFQKEFVVPGYLDGKFVFQMASLGHSWYLAGNGYSNYPRHNARYYEEVFTNKNKEANWVMPVVPKTLPANIMAVKGFVTDLRSKKMGSSTQARPSVFTRHFVEPFIEKSTTYLHSGKPTVFGWMYDIDNQSEGVGWNYNMTSPHLLRSSPTNGHYFSACGLISEKTFGIKSIMLHVFTTPEYHKSQHVDFNLSIGNPQGYVNVVTQKSSFISAVQDIYSANFVPNDEVENAIKSFGSTDYPRSLARINQLLFLSEESLTIMQALYKCQTYENLVDCLNFCMPHCLEALETLDYSRELKDHVSSMLNYFWNTTIAISEELKLYDTPEQ
jgi:hypothetical protein